MPFTDLNKTVDVWNYLEKQDLTVGEIDELLESLHKKRNKATVLKRSKTPIDMSDSEIRLYLGIMGTAVVTEFRLDNDGETLHLISGYDGSVIGTIDLIERDIQFIGTWARGEQ